MTSVIPVICGNADIPNQQDVLFTELTPMTTKDVAKPKPDLFDGANLQDVDEMGGDRQDERSLYPVIIPTKYPTVPVAPSFFIRAKRPDGSAAMVQRQACYDGAYGPRAMHSLQNYGEDEPIYDGNAYTYSSTYHGGLLKLYVYTHHVTAPTTQGGRPEYHMAQLDAWGMTGNRKTFIRDSFIQAANARAQGLDPTAAKDSLAGITGVHQNEGSSPAEFLDCEESAESQDVPGEAALPSLQQGLIDNNVYTPFQENDDGSAFPQYLHADDDVQDQSQASELLDAGTDLSPPLPFSPYSYGWG
jgi:hypothetical protein